MTLDVLVSSIDPSAHLPISLPAYRPIHPSICPSVHPPTPSTSGQLVLRRLWRRGLRRPRWLRLPPVAPVHPLPPHAHAHLPLPQLAVAARLQDRQRAGRRPRCVLPARRAHHGVSVVSVASKVVSSVASVASKVVSSVASVASKAVSRVASRVARETRLATLLLTRYVRPQPWGPPAVLLATCATMLYIGHHALPPAIPHHPQPFTSLHLTHFSHPVHLPPPPPRCRSCAILRFRPPAGVTLSEGDPPPPVSRVTPAGGKKKAKA